MRNTAVLLTTLSLGAALLGVPSTAHAETCPDPADQIIAGWYLNEEMRLRDTDPFAFSPGQANLAFSHTGYCFPLTLTVERPDGSDRHLTVIDRIADGAGIGYHQFGWDWFDYASGTPTDGGLLSWLLRMPR